jgi:hypothetical protein
MAKLKPTPRSNSSDAHEYIDISQTSDTDDAPQDLRPEPSPVPAKGSKTKAYDIRFFFPPFEGDGGMQICKICKYVVLPAQIHDLHYLFKKLLSRAKADSGLLTGRANYKYMSTTASTNLRNHLFKLHEAEYLVEAAKNGWQTTVKPSKQPGAKGDRPPFTMENFISHLLRFIVADDQVSSVLYYLLFSEIRDLLLVHQCHRMPGIPGPYPPHASRAKRFGYPTPNKNNRVNSCRMERVVRDAKEGASGKFDPLQGVL